MKKIRLTDYKGNEQIISSQEELVDVLFCQIKETNVVFILDSGEFGVLTVGISKELGFVEHMSQQQLPPYLVAKQESNHKAAEEPEFVEFYQGGTLTPIPRSLCIPISIVKEIVVHFYESGDRIGNVNWVMI